VIGILFGGSVALESPSGSLSRRRWGSVSQGWDNPRWGLRSAGHDSRLSSVLWSKRYRWLEKVYKFVRKRKKVHTVEASLPLSSSSMRLFMSMAVIWCQPALISICVEDSKLYATGVNSAVWRWRQDIYRNE
jgi:hypothetical protein